MLEMSFLGKFAAEGAQPLTESCLTWLISLRGRGPAESSTAAASMYALREHDRTMSTVATHTTCRKSLWAVGFASILLAATPITASAQETAAKSSNESAASTAEAAPVARRESPAGFMKRVGNELLAASRSGSAAQFAMVLNSNADVPSIGISALGEYARSLPKTDRPIYYNGMINFIARYASKEAPKYPVARFIVTAQSKDDPRGTYVDSRITLVSGESYDVRWLVVRRGTTYKVRDAQVIGFWMTSFLDNLFQSFISDNGGNPKALVVALNR